MLFNKEKVRRISIIITLFLFNFLIQAKDFKGGEIQSIKEFHFGRFETRFYSSNVSGMLSTFFLFEKDGYKSSDIWQEVDIEVFGKGDANSWQSNPIYQFTGNGERQTSESVHEFENGGSSDEWHVYTLDWTPDYLEWFVDGKSIRKYTDKEALKILGKKPMKAMFNHWTSKWTDWTGPFNGDDTPSFQFVDYLKVYDWVSGSTFKEAPSFEDHFDKGLSNWTISEHTFDGNLCDFTPENVKTKKGYLILSFTKADTTIYYIKIPEPTYGNNIDFEKYAKKIKIIESPVTGTLPIKSKRIIDNSKVNIYDEKGLLIGTYRVKNKEVDAVKNFSEGDYYYVEEGKRKASIFKFHKN